ncbi:helix-turn-helix domain-containing protein [Isoalcanivorax indicus]|uniref:helix-turn-helix domain-containing protein n=1 Tax=Isoalcanivorax indicus TaxID=2202653 RepID=UPI000DBA0BF8|nr:helix-turn-helix domain-containing protein [Isoalcanivorax indicus]
MTDTTPVSGTLFLWHDRWMLLGHLPANKTHRHVSASLLLGLDGDFELEVEGERRLTRAAVVAPDVAQALNPGQTTMLVAQLDPDSDAWRRLAGTLAGRPSADLPLPERLARALARSNDCGALSGNMAQLLTATGASPLPLDARVADICNYLRETLPEKLDATALAARVGLSASRLTHLFREQTGVTLRRFLLYLKITRAVARWEPGMTLSTLAAEAGFYDQPHLVRTARDMFDALPSVYIGTGQFRICRCAAAH